jgi:hypothetical protein
MAMVYAAPPPRRARMRDSQAEVPTRVFVRPTHQAWRNVFLQPWAPGDAPLPWAGQSRRSAPTLPRVSIIVRRRPRRSMMPWVLFLAAFGIAFGIGKDRALRAELGANVRVMTARALVVLDDSARRLGRQVADLR